MTTPQHPTTTAADPLVPDDVSESFGARLARASRRKQGLPERVTDPTVRERLTALCGLPRVGSDAPDQLDSPGE